MAMGLSWTLNEWINPAEVLYDNTYSGKLKVIGRAWSNIGVTFYGMGLYNLLYLKNEWMN